MFACSVNAPSEEVATTRSALISDAVHDQGTPGFYFLPPMVPSFPAQLAASAPPSAVVGPWVVIDSVSLSPAGCTTDCVATVLTPNVTTITPTGTSTGTAIPLSKGDARNRVKYHVNRDASNAAEAEPDDDLDDVPDGYWSARWNSEDFGTVVNGFYRAHIYASVDGSPLELGFADIEVVPDGISKAAYRKIDRSLYTPLKYGRSLGINFQIQPEALRRPVKTLATGLIGPRIAIDDVNVYWTDGYAGNVQKVPLAGGTVTTLASGIVSASMALSPSGIYFSTFTGVANQDTVQRVPLAGGTPQVIASGLTEVGGIAVDGTSVYWSQVFDYRTGFVQKAPLEGGPVTGLASPVDGVYQPGSLSVRGGFVYWSDSNSGAIRRAPTSGATPPSAFITTNNKSYALTTDASNVYWTELDVNVAGQWLLRAAPLAGGAPTTLVASAALDANPGKFVSDGQYLYYTLLVGGFVYDYSATGYVIMKVPVGGGTPAKLVSRSEGVNVYPTSLAVDGTSLYWGVGAGLTPTSGAVYTAPK
jgi:hypothetical protein